MASVAKTPLTILFGLSPVGLTATAETDITIYNNHVNQCQEFEFRGPLEALVKVVMLDLFGEIYEDIVFDFVDLVSMNEKERSLIRKSSGDTDVAYITAGVFTPEEIRAKVANDPDSGFTSIDVDKPKGKLMKPAPAKPGKGGAGGGGGSAPDPSMTAAANGPDSSKDERLPALRAAADLMLQDAKRMASDAFTGNQHTGGIGGKDEDPTTTAMKHSAVAMKATRVANTTDTRAAHQTALAAHSRALEAHKHALVSAPSDLKHVHDSYIEAHPRPRRSSCDQRARRQR